jgi:hypothetical protein
LLWVFFIALGALFVRKADLPVMLFARTTEMRAERHYSECEFIERGASYKGCTRMERRIAAKGTKRRSGQIEGVVTKGYR